MTATLCSAICSVHDYGRNPPAALFATAPIFSALAPRASFMCSVTPPLLALLRRAPFFCFTQVFRFF
jgi:hypothetical protein